MPGRRMISVNLDVVDYCKTSRWTLICKEMTDFQQEGRVHFDTCLQCLSLPPSLSFFVLAQGRGSGVRGQAARAARFLVSGKIQTFGYRGATYRAWASLAVAGTSYGHYLHYHPAEQTSAAPSCPVCPSSPLPSHTDYSSISL